MTRDAAELRARLASLSERAVLRVLHRAAQAGQPEAVDAVMEELARRGMETDPKVALAVTDAKRCDDFWHTVTGLRTARCPACGSSSSEVWLRTEGTRSRKFRPRQERPARASGAAADDDWFDVLLDFIDDYVDD